MPAHIGLVLRLPVDGDVAEKLRSVRRRQALSLWGPFLEHDLGAKRLVGVLRLERPGMDRAGDKLPERIEVLERRFVRVEVKRGGEMHVGGDPDSIADAGALRERENFGDFKFAATRRTVVGLCDSFRSPSPGQRHKRLAN
jgi:hypothetical protein